MNTSPTPAAFRLNRVLFPESHIVIALENVEQLELSFDIEPSGVDFVEERQFQLVLSIHVISQAQSLDIKVKAVADFDYDEGISKSDYFLKNAPAILFPYIRAYLANLTAQSGLITFLMPTFNLSEMGNQLKANLRVIG